MSNDLKRCPQCGVSQPAVSWRCACGYAFAGEKGVEMEISRVLATGQSPNKIIEDLRQRGMSTADAARLVNMVEDKRHKQRETRQNRIAFGVAAVGCFVACWVSTILIRRAGGGEAAGSIAGTGISGFFTWQARDLELPGIIYGAIFGSAIQVML